MGTQLLDTFFFVDFRVRGILLELTENINVEDDEQPAIDDLKHQRITICNRRYWNRLQLNMVIGCIG